MDNTILSYGEFEETSVLFEEHDNEHLPEDEWENVAERIFYTENSDEFTSRGVTEEKFLGMTMEEKNKLLSELNLNFKFVLTFGTSITAFFPLVQGFIEKGTDGIRPDNMTVAYLTICAVAIVLGQPKESYRKLFSELRMRNVYGLLKDLTGCMVKIQKVFSFISSTVGRVIKEFTGMLAYTMLFVPFILTLQRILSSERITLVEFTDAVSEDGGFKLMSVGLGLTGIVVKELIIMLFQRLKDLREEDLYSVGMGFVKKVWGRITDMVKRIREVDIEKVKEQLDDIEEEMLFDGDRVYKWNQWNKKSPSKKDRVDRPDEALTQT